MAALSSVNHIGHCVTDLTRTRRFYEELLGFKVQRELKIPDGPASKLLQVPSPVGMTALYLELDGFVLELLHFDRPGNAPQRERSFTEPGLTHLSFSVPDLAYSIEQVPKLGGTVLEDTVITGIAAMTRDPDGQLLELLPSSYRAG
jgi:catechol 2,3-dioxygenase-like lactoylglutathione lyase family enzyme